MYSVFAPMSCSQVQIVLAVNSDPLSEQTLAPARKCRRLFRHTPLSKQLGQTFLNIPQAQFSAHSNRHTGPVSYQEALTGGLVDHVQQPKWPLLIRSIHDEIIAPNVIGTFRPQADARPISATTDLVSVVLRHFQPFQPPDICTCMQVQVYAPLSCGSPTSLRSGAAP